MKYFLNLLATGLVALFFLIVLSWTIVATSICWWFNLKSGLTPQDLSHTSWLGSPALALHFTTSFFSYFLGAALLLMGLAISVARNSIIPAIVSTIMIIFFAGISEKSATSLGILEGTIKIGCFVESTKECAQMLDLPTAGTYSMYETNPESKGIELSARYLAERNKVVTDKTLQTALVMYTFPLYWIKAPLYLFELDSLQPMINAQRQHVFELQAKSH